ncbi:MAG: DUF971 domain-containing protein [Ardenticatenaceae bacterium]|nr:DUF971 domain-containing protein [Ardenticatenaceae bacterium]
MSTPRTRPAGITADRNERILTITWGDGHVSRYSFAGLRAVCPCVECKGGHANMGGPPDPRVVRDTPPGDLNLEAIERMGSYALNFRWSDGHWTGIYTWEMLRAACPCAACLEE